MAVGISVQRAKTKEAFADSELELLTELGRHAEKSLRLGIRLLDAELANVGLGEILSRIGIAVFALDLLGRVVFSNPAAASLIGQRIEIVDGRLRMGASAERQAIDAAIGRMLGPNPDMR